MDSTFASLSIPRVSLVNKEKDRYLVIRKNGEKVVLEATSAAEAVEKSGIQDARKIINLAFEAEQILEKGVLGATDEKFETRITMEEELHEFHVADLLNEESEEEAFIEFDLVEFSQLSHQGAPRIPEREVEILTAVVETQTAPDIETTEPAKQVEIIDAPVEHALQESEKQLTPEEVEALLKS